MNASPFRLDGKTVLISGAGGGIGRALVETFHAAGATIVGADRQADMLEGLPLARSVLFDQTDAKSTRAAVQADIAAHGVVDVVIANAGFTRAEHLGHLDDDVWASEMAINLNGAYALVDPITHAMAARGAGNVVFISSVNALQHFGNPAYSAAKAGLIAYARAIAVERGGEGVRANLVAPGCMVSPQEVANAALFLASDAASGITGVTIPVDAGLTAGNLRFVNEVLRAQ